MIELDFATVLSAPAAITAICGTRIYPLVLPTDPILPAIDYSFVGGSATSTFDTTGSKKYRVEVNCWGDTYSDAVTLRAAVTAALNGYLDANLKILLIQPRDFFDRELEQYRAMVEFYLFSNL